MKHFSVKFALFTLFPYYAFAQSLGLGSTDYSKVWTTTHQTAPVDQTTLRVQFIKFTAVNYSDTTQEYTLKREIFDENEVKISERTLVGTPAKMQDYGLVLPELSSQIVSGCVSQNYGTPETLQLNGTSYSACLVHGIDPDYVTSDGTAITALTWAGHITAGAPIGTLGSDVSYGYAKPNGATGQVMTHSETISISFIAP